MKNFKALWNEEVSQNRERWKSQATKGTVQNPQEMVQSQWWRFNGEVNTEVLKPDPTEQKRKKWAHKTDWDVMVHDDIGYTGGFNFGSTNPVFPNRQGKAIVFV